MTVQHTHERFLIWRDGLRWHYQAEGRGGAADGWRFTERGAKRAARRHLRHRHGSRLSRHAR